MPDLDPNPAPELPSEPVRETIPSIDLREKDEPAWTGWEVLLIAMVALLSIFAFTLGAFAVARRLYLFKDISLIELGRDSRIVVPVQLAAYAVVLAFMYWIVRGHGRRFWRALQWNWPRAAAAFPYLAGGIVLALAVQFSPMLLPFPKELPIERFFHDPTSAYLLGIFGITAAPLVEELFFRGFLYPVLARRMGVAAGVIVTSILFALIHESQLGYAWAPLLLLFVVGLALTITRVRTGSVAAGFLMHVAYNFTLFVLLWISSDHFHHFERMS